MEALSQLSYLRPYPSYANFILCQVLEREAHTLKQALTARGILIRYYASPGLVNHVRFSVGTPEQTERLIAELRSV